MHLTLNGDAATLTSHSVKTGLFSIINDKARSNSAPGARSGLLASGGGQRAGFVAFESGCIPNLYVACGPAKRGYEQSSPDWRAEKAPGKFFSPKNASWATASQVQEIFFSYQVTLLAVDGELVLDVPKARELRRGEERCCERCTSIARAEALRGQHRGRPDE